MSFPRYPEYKDSGVEWLGTVPAHWNVNRLKRLARLLTEKTDRREKPVALENIESWSGSFVETEAMFSGEGVGFEPGDILFGKLRPYLAKVLLAAFSGEAVGDFHVLHPASSVHGRFLQFQLLNADFISLVDGSTYGAKMPRASWDFMGNVALAAPPLSEQTAIAAFLDRETAKIDALVAEQETLIALLKEKRQAVISHAVTKGLNPDAPMKPSDIEWLGDVPAHWDVAKGSRIGSLFGSEQVPEESVRDFGQLPFIKVSSLSANDFCIESWDWFVDEDIAVSSRPHSRFVVFPKRGAAIFMNKVNVVTVPALLDPNLMGWEIREGADPLFFAYVLKIRRLESLADISTVPQINNKHIAPELFPVPPKNEQHEIVASLDKRLFEVDALTQEANRAITLLKERRSALISAAVTGQIDVRGLAG